MIVLDHLHNLLVQIQFESLLLLLQFLILWLCILFHFFDGEVANVVIEFVNVDKVAVKASVSLHRCWPLVALILLIHPLEHNSEL